MDVVGTKRTEISLAWGLLATALALALGVGVGRFGGTLRTGGAPGASTAAHAALPTQDAVTRYMVPVSDVQPSIGPSDALITIVEYCDLPDAGCAAIEPALQALRKRYATELRLAFRHYAHPDQPGSLLAHLFVRAAQERGGKFWEARALLLAHQGEFTMADAERYARQVGLDWPTVKDTIEKRTFLGLITADRLFADMFEVQNLPALFVNGRPLAAPPNPRELERVVAEELTHARELVTHGTPKSDLYAQLIKKGKWIPYKKR